MTGPGALLLAFAGGLVSFLSPCTVPLLPGYLSYISGLGSEEIGRGENSGTLLGAAALFVVGFSLIFVALGATASWIGSELLPYRDTLTRVSGLVIIGMALVMVGAFRLPVLMMERRFHPAGGAGSGILRDLGIWGALPLGMAFAFGWSPCIGPVLTSILAYATQEDTAQKGAMLLFVYALGFGAPFLLMAAFAGRLFESLTWIKRHFVAINRAGGLMLLVMGVFLAMNRWTEIVAPVMRWYGNLHLPS